MPKDMPADVKIEAIAGKPVELPSGDFIANAAMTREGGDLHLTSPDGHTIVVEGYFAQQSPPDLVTHDGARLTSAMVDAFVPPERAGQYAASGQTATDASPAGRITQVVGEAHVVHADGTRVPATVGTPIYQGDVIETSKTGAVNIQFADNTTFAISESARMSVDQFVYHSADHSGSSFFSMLQGVFVYTSGLIGKTNPADVSIETPVGSIGIRGTVVAGHILPAGQQSQITILDGAITVTNGAGTQDLNTSFATVSVSGYQSQPIPMQMDAQTFNNSYHAVSAVAGDSLGHFTSGSAPSSTAPANNQAPAQAPSGEAAPAPAAAPQTAPEAAPASPTGSNTPTAPAPADSTTAQATAPAPAPVPAPVPATIPTAPTSTASTSPSAPPSGSTFSGRTNTSSFDSSGSTSFTAPAPGTTDGSATMSAPPRPTTTTTNTTTNTTTTTQAPPPFTVNAVDSISGPNVAIGTQVTYTLTFSSALPASTVAAMLSNPGNYFSNHGTANITIQGVTSTSTPNQYVVTVLPTTTGTLRMGLTGITDVRGIQLANPIQSTTDNVTHAMDVQWGPAYLKGTPAITADDGISSFLQNGSVIGKVVPLSGATVGSYKIIITSAGQEYSAIGVPQSIANPNSVFVIAANGDIVVNNFLALSEVLNPGGLNIRVEAYSGAGGTGTLLDSIDRMVKLDNYIDNGVTGSATIYSTGNHIGNTSTSNYMITTSAGGTTLTGGTAADILVAAGGTSGSMGTILIGNGGADILIGGAGNDVFKISDDAFKAIEGNGGNNKLVLEGNATPFNFTTGHSVRNISEIDFNAATGDNGIMLNAQSIFDMTNSVTGTPANTLKIMTLGGAAHNYVDVSGLTLTTGIWGVSQYMTYTGNAANGSLVTLNVRQFANAGDSLGSVGAIFVEDAAHNVVSSSYTTATNVMTTTNNQMFVGAATFNQKFYDGGYTGAILIGNNSTQGNDFNISNDDFTFIDGGANHAADNFLYLNNSSSEFSIDFSSISGAVKNIDGISLGGFGGKGNSITLDIKDVFNMTNADDSYTLHISNLAVNGTSLASVTVLSDANGVFTQTSGPALSSLNSAINPSQIFYTGNYQGHTVTLVIDNATNVSTAQGLVGSGSIHVATATA